MESENRVEMLSEFREKANLVIHDPELFRKQGMERAYFYDKNFAGCTQSILGPFLSFLILKIPYLCRRLLRCRAFCIMRRAPVVP